MMGVPGNLLAQVRPAGTGAVLLLDAGQSRVEVTLIMIAANAAITVDLHHDNDGQTYDNTNLIADALPVTASNPVAFQAQSPGTGITIRRGGSLGVATSVADSAVISVYGNVAQVHEGAR